MHLISDPELNCRTSDQLDAGSCCGFQTTLFLSGKKFWAQSHLGQRNFKTLAEFWHCHGILAHAHLHGKLWCPKLTLSSTLSSFVTYLISQLTLNPQVCSTPDHASGAIRRWRNKTPSSLLYAWLTWLAEQGPDYVWLSSAHKTHRSKRTCQQKAENSRGK